MIRRYDCDSIRKAIKNDYLIKKETVFSQRRANGAIKKYFSDFRSLEMLDPSWSDRLTEAENADISSFSVNETEAEHLMVYFVFRYFMTAVFDLDLLSKSKFASVSFIIIEKLCASSDDGKENRIRIMQRFSKEVEHSASNMKFLDITMKKSRFYSVQNLINLIQEK